jgi:hypothetical protein
MLSPCSRHASELNDRDVPPWQQGAVTIKVHQQKGQFWGHQRPKSSDAARVWKGRFDSLGRGAMNGWCRRLAAIGPFGAEWLLLPHCKPCATLIRQL